MNVKGFDVPEGYMGYVKAKQKYMLFETEKAYYEYLLEREEV